MKSFCYRRRSKVPQSPFRLVAFLIILLSSTSQLVKCFMLVVGAGDLPRSAYRSTGVQHRHFRQQKRQQQQREKRSRASTISRSTTASKLTHTVLRSTAARRIFENDDHIRGGDALSSSTPTDSFSHTEGGDNLDDDSTLADIPYLQSDLYPGFWPRLDNLDRRLIKVSLPVIANFAINPLIGAVDLFWVNRMGDALAVAGQAAANQVFNSMFFLTSFLPAITATLVSRQNAAGNKEGVQEAVGEALFVGIFMAVLASATILFQPSRVLSSVLQQGAPAWSYAKPYLLIRAFAFLPSLISLVGFSAFRGILDTTTPVKISSFANVFNAVLDPILIFTLAMGVPGAALATLAAEIISAITYLFMLKKRDMVQFANILRPPSWTRLQPLLQGGAALQLRNVALNLTFLAVARVVQGIDSSGVSAAAHAISIQTFQVGGIVLLGLSTVAQTVVPNDLVERYHYEPTTEQHRRIGGPRYAKATVNRLMSWGLLLGIALGGFQLALIPVIRNATPLQAVRDAAKTPCILASVFQIMNGLVFIGEGVMVGTGSFFQLSLSTMIATAGCLWALRIFPAKFGLAGVWFSFGVWNSLRLLGVCIHQFVRGPLTTKNLKSYDTLHDTVIE